MPHEMVIQADIGGIQIALTVPLDGAKDRQDEILDRSLKTVNRARAHQSLVEALIDTQARKERIEQIPAAIQELGERRIREKVEMRALWQAQHDATGRRSEFAEQAQHKKALVDFDIESEAQLKKLRDERAQLEKELPIYEMQVTRQRMILAGKDRSEVITMKPIAEAAA